MNAENFLKNEVPYKVRRNLEGTFSRAYADTRNLKLADSAFSSRKGEETLTFVRNLKVEEQIKTEIDKGFLPFSYTEKKNCADNCTHYEYETENAVITVSRVTKENEMPRKAKFRENLSFNNQISLFDDEDIKSKKHIIITHVSEEDQLKCLMIGIPSADGRTWECNFNLLKELQIITTNDEDLPDNTIKIRKSIREGKV